MSGFPGGSAFVPEASGDAAGCVSNLADLDDAHARIRVPALAFYDRHEVAVLDAVLEAARAGHDVQASSVFVFLLASTSPACAPTRAAFSLLGSAGSAQLPPPQARNVALIAASLTELSGDEGIAYLTHVYDPTAIDAAFPCVGGKTVGAVIAESRDAGLVPVLVAVGEVVCVFGREYDVPRLIASQNLIDGLLPTFEATAAALTEAGVAGDDDVVFVAVQAASPRIDAMRALWRDALQGPSPPPDPLDAALRTSGRELPDGGLAFALPMDVAGPFIAREFNSDAAEDIAATRARGDLPIVVATADDVWTSAWVREDDDDDDEAAS